MSKSVKDYVAAAKAVVDTISAPAAQKMMAGGALLLDVRGAKEVEKTGKAVGAVNIPRGMLEFRADASMPTYLDVLQKDRVIITYCASGGRATLSAERLMEMGYGPVYSMGSLQDWTDAGGEVEAADD